MRLLPGRFRLYVLLRWLAFVAVLVVLTAACAERGGSSDQVVRQGEGDGIHQVLKYGPLVPTPVKDVLARSNQVLVRAVVESAGAPRWNTPEHHRPTEQESRRYMIMSPFQIRPLKVVLRGSLPTNEVVVAGGTAGPDSTDVSLWPAGIRGGGRGAHRPDPSRPARHLG
jgi:hypothetical protein